MSKNLLDLSGKIDSFTFPTPTNTAKALLEILNSETGEQDRYRLVEDMMESSASFKNDFDEKLQLLEELKSGILERL
ncbi:MAG: hypothetical protein KAT27_08755 [Desulfobacterales bacterium]|nr:hypothetical protein [Desulfobacterales bacterium]